MSVESVLWNVVLFHNEKFKEYKDNPDLHCAHIQDWHDKQAFERECEYADKTGYYRLPA